MEAQRWAPAEPGAPYVCPAHDLGSIVAMVMCADEATVEERKRLIAAAPELLGHLRFAVKLLSALPGFSGTAQVEAMQAAISKAEGTDTDQ